MALNPKLMKTKWDLTLLYKSPKDPQIERDLVNAEKEFTDFAQKYAGRTDYLEDANKLAEALADSEKLDDSLIGKPSLYFNYLSDLDSRDEKVQAKLNLLTDRVQKITQQTLFFPVALSRIAPDKQQEFLQSEILKPYRYSLKTTFDHSKHMLTEAEEKVMRLKSLPAYDLWVRSNEKLLGKQLVIWQGKKLPLPEAMGKISSLATKERRALAALISEKLQLSADTAEAELNAIVLNKKINDELRGYKQPQDATIMGYENDPATVENLVKTVSKAFRISHRFYKLKAKMLKLKRLEYCDRSAPVGKTKKEIKFPEAVKLVQRAFHKFDPFYAETLTSFLDQGQIDVFPKQGKTGGAYCSHYGTLPVFVLLNHTNGFRDLTTLAHEMGHAFHSTLSTQHQPPMYRDYTIATAEVASTFFENLVFDEVLPTLSPSEQVVALHDKLNDSISTIFRQIACYNFELELHQTIRREGSMSKEAIATLMNKHMGAYLGPVFKLREDDGYFFVTWSHLRRFFYVYSYAFGEIVSSALYAKYKQDPSFKDKVKHFLTLGGSMSPEDIFASIGIDVRHPAFFQEGLKKIEADIAKLEKLVAGKVK